MASPIQSNVMKWPIVAPDGSTNLVWLRSYPKGVPPVVESGNYRSLNDYVDEAVNRFADRTAFLSMGAEMSYARLGAHADAFAGWLQSVGVKKGDRVALMMPNILQYPVAIFGALRIGAVVVNVNPLYTERELHHQLKDSGAEVIVVMENFAATLQKALAGTSIRKVVLTQAGDLMSGGNMNLRGRLVNLAVRRVKKLVPPYQLPGPLWLREALNEGQRYGVKRPPLSLEDLAFLQYTGGTTGASKGAMLSHGNVLMNCLQSKAMVEWQLDAHEIETIVTPLPLYHVYSLGVNCLAFMFVGGRNVLIAEPRDIKGMVRQLRGIEFTALSGVNTLFAALLDNEEFRLRDFSKVKLVMSGGMALQRGVAERWYAATGNCIAEGWGLTECSPTVTAAPRDLRVQVEPFVANVGVPVPSTEVRCRRDDGTWANINEPGELCVRGPQVMKGYWRRPDETAKVLDDQGWLATGDIGVIDEEGFVKIVGRKKDMVIVSGFNVYPNEIEDVIAMHPDVKEVAAIGVPDQITGEVLKVVVVPRNSRLTKEALIEHCRKQLTGYKIPRIVEFRTTDLPKSPVGKILRKELR